MSVQFFLFLPSSRVHSTSMHLDEIHHRMGRRRTGWDYGTRAIYMVTIELATRGHPTLASWPIQDASTSQWHCPLTNLGEKVLSCWKQIPQYWPQISLLAAVVMPDHFHGILFIRAPLSSPSPSRVSQETVRPKSKSLGDVIRGFKTGCREAHWAPGFVDTILFRKGQLSRMVRYIRDNPERLARKRANPTLFRRVQDISRQLPLPDGPRPLHFQALGNLSLLDWPLIHPVQCSCSFFRYRREQLPSGAWRILRDSDGIPLVESSTLEFEAKCEDALRHSAHGAVLVSPCLSHGEREIMRRAHATGVRVILLRNKGFSKHEKPVGALFDTCADGKLLLLSPAAWQYLPGEVPPTRGTSLILNYLAHLLAVSGDPRNTPAPITYRGPTLPNLIPLLLQACTPPHS